MIIKTEAELAGMREIGRICARVLKLMGERLAPGMTTKELDDYGGELFASMGAVSAPIYCYKFPGYNCISVNDEVAHGIPGDYVIQPGDIVNIDVSAMKNGFFADNGASFAVEPVKSGNSKLLQVCKTALNNALAVVRAGKPINCIGLAVEKEARRHGMRTIRNLCGHGVGHTLHDEPASIYNYFDRHDKRIMQAGLILAIEPFVSLGDDYVDEMENGWTLKTPGRSQVAQFEHTVMVREGQPPLILTLAD